LRTRVPAGCVCLTPQAVPRTPQPAEAASAMSPCVEPSPVDVSAPPRYIKIVVVTLCRTGTEP
jgi:hypothetical protein